MKNIPTLKLEIQRVENLSKVDIKQMKPAAYTRERKKRELCQHLVKYLETSPTLDFVESEIKRMERLISSKLLEFDHVMGDKVEKISKRDLSKLRKEHESKYGISKVRTQLKTLRYLVS